MPVSPPRTLSSISALRRALRDCLAVPGSTDPAELLTRRMALMGLAPDDLALDGAPSWQELQRICAACAHRARCAHDLANEFADPAWDAWRNYCPDATTLSISRTLRGCHVGE